MISTVCFNIFLIVLLIAFIFLILAGMYYVGRKIYLDIQECIDWEDYQNKRYREKYEEKVKELKKEYDEKLHEETRKIIKEFYDNDPNNPKNKKENERNEVR